MNETPPIAATIAGSDSSGGAGIQADLKTFSALGVFGASILTALTAQNSQGVSAIHDVPDAFIAAQIDSVFSDLNVRATKIGMLSRAGAIAAVAAGLDRWNPGAIVLDPVMVATSGSRLLDPQAIDGMKAELFARAHLITPNLPEAAALLGLPLAETEADMRVQAERLLNLGARAVLLKGGHAMGPESVDLFMDEAGLLRLAAPRLPSANTHGTGCTLSSAIAAGLALGKPMRMAVRDAKAYVTSAIAAADRLDVGAGHGPVHHFFAFWP